MNHTETNEYWRDVVIKWLHSEKSSALSYVGDFDRDNLDSVCLDGSFDLEELAKVLRQSDKELILGKMEEQRKDPTLYARQAFNKDLHCSTCGGQEDCTCKVENKMIDTCKSIVEEVMR